METMNSFINAIKFGDNYQQYQKSKNMQRGIKQFKIRCGANDLPFKFMSPYQLLRQLNTAIQGRYDVQFIEVRYKISNTKAQLTFNNNILPKDRFQIDTTYNNIFNGEHIDLVEKLFGDAVELKPPQDFDPNVLDNILEAEKIKEEDQRVREIDSGVEMIMAVAEGQKTGIKGVQLKTLDRFKMTHDKQMAENQIQILVKGKTTQPVIERIQHQKNAKNPLEIKYANRTLRLYLHPAPGELEKMDALVDLSRFSSWAMCTIPTDPQKTDAKSQGYYYFDMEQVQKNVQKLAPSIKVSNSLTLHTNVDTITGFDIYSFMFNQLVLKVSIKLGQVERICHTRSMYQNHRVQEYYFYLKYPPKYSLTVLKKDVGVADAYLKNWERVENFPLMRSKLIKANDLLRLYLFNNTILKIKLCEDLAEGYSVSKSLDKLQSILKMFKGNYPITSLPHPIKFSLSIKTFQKEFNYRGFLQTLKLTNLEQKDKVWKIKFFILILVRKNSLAPRDITDLLSFIQVNQDGLDIFLFIFWRTTTSTWGYQRTDISFVEYIKKQFIKIQEMGSQAILRQLSLNTEMIAHVFRAKLTPSGYLYDPPTPEMKGRLLKEFSNQSEFFMRVSICDESGGTLKNQRYITKIPFRNAMKQIIIVDRKYITLGWSPSQLRSYSLWYMHEVQKPRGNLKQMKRDHVLSFLGDFSLLTNPAKKAARIGQSFSASWTFKVRDLNQLKENDRKSDKGFLYTDGIGKISSDLLDKIGLKLSLKELSVIQMRYKGCKGVLVLDTTLPFNTIVLRPSLIKFPCHHDAAKQYLDILDWNKYKPGFLNRQVIILLKTLGIRDEVFKRLQEEHIQRIQSLSFKDCSIFKQLHTDLSTEVCNLEPANQTILQLLRAGFRLDEEPFFRGVLKTLKKNGYHLLKDKSSIRVQKSARIIGIIDEFGVLNENEVYCSIMDHFGEFIHKPPNLQVIEGDVIVTRNPCLHPADIRKLKCVGEKQITRRFQELGFDRNMFQPYVNTVIFPMKGLIPITAQISGSDLDGDNFWISWEERLIPKSHFQESTIDDPTASSSPPKKIDVSYDRMLDFFIDYLNYEKLGQIDNSHLVHADRDPNNFANNKICLELAQVHGKAVDFPKTGYCPPINPKLLVSEYPDFMQKQGKDMYNSESILGVLYRDVKQRIDEITRQNEKNQGKGKILGQIDRQLLEGKLHFQRYEISDAIKVIKEYEVDLRNLISMTQVDSEYQIYSGNFSNVKNTVISFGKNRLIGTILHLRTRFAEIFFEDFTIDKEKYQNVKENNLESFTVFTQAVRSKAQLYYLVSYVYKFHKFQLGEKFESMLPLLDQIKDVLAEHGINLDDPLEYQRTKYCGFVWFVVPKIIINIKNICRRKNQPQSSRLEVNKDNNGSAERANKEHFKEDWDEGVI